MWLARFTHQPNRKKTLKYQEVDFLGRTIKAFVTGEFDQVPGLVLEPVNPEES